jgi:hypothetical protein
MKHTYECTEKEFISVVKLLQTVVQAVVDVRAINKADTVVLSEDGAELYSDGEDDQPARKEKKEKATVHPFRVVEPEPARKTEQEVQDNIVNEPEPLPAEFLKKQKRLKKGEKAFAAFIHEWLMGVDLATMELVPDVQQPDRDLLLRSLANSPSAYSVLTFVSECGGLQRAVAKVVNDEDLSVRLCRYIVPPASIAFPDLAGQYEYTNPFRKEEDEDGDA